MRPLLLPLLPTRFFILVYVCWTGCRVGSRPFHSQLVQGGPQWVCEPGYFKTSKVVSAATCKACSTGLSVDKCKAEERFVPCSADANAHCEACPVLLLPTGSSLLRYMPGVHDCQVKNSSSNMSSFI
jgi:hypothetical protein